MTVPAIFKGTALLTVLLAALFDARAKRVPAACFFAGTLCALWPHAALFIQDVSKAVWLSALPFARGAGFTLFLLLFVIGAEKITEKTLFGGGDLREIFVLSAAFPLAVSLNGLLYALLYGLGFFTVRRLLKAERGTFPFVPALFFGWTAALSGVQTMNWWW